MYALTARYLGPTDHRGSRYIVQDGTRRTVHSYSYESNTPAVAAIREHVDACNACGALAHVDGYQLRFATLPGGDTVAVWTVRP